MYQSVNFTEFRNAFFAMGRDTQFSPDALRIIFYYLGEYEESTGEHVELDVIAICCDFTEMTESEIREDYSLDIDEDVEEYLSYNTALCGTFKDEAGNDVYVFQQF